MIIGFAGYGLLMGGLESLYRRATGGLIALLIPLLAGYQFFLLRGDLMPAIAYLAPALLCCAFVAPKASGARSPMEHRSGSGISSSSAQPRSRSAA